MSPTRVAAIDCGTNSIRLLIADRSDGRLRDVLRRMEVVRLGQGVDQTGRIAPQALARTLAMTADYARQCREAGVQVIRFVATSASRDAENRQEFVDGVHALLGVEPEVVSGPEEAELSFAGARSAIAERTGGPYLTVDLGGGSTELVLGEEQVHQAVSMDVGCVRMTERHLRSDPPTQAQIEAATADIDAALGRAGQVVDLGRTRSLVGLAGTVTTVTAYALGLSAYDPDRIDGTALSVSRVHELCDELLHMTRAQRQALPFMHPGRVDVIGAGALVWSRVVQRVVDEVAGAGGELDTVWTSEHDILDGIALSAN